MTLRVALALALTLAGCDVSMTKQSRYDTYAPAALWPDDTSARPLPAHVIAQGDLDREKDATSLPPATPALLKRGQEHFDIYCSPCHGLDGKGNGPVVARGFPHPPSYFDARLMKAPASEFYDAITQGYGVMYSYASRIAPRDRWAIIAYIRALQLSRHATVAQAPEVREKLR